MGVCKTVADEFGVAVFVLVTIAMDVGVNVDVLGVGVFEVVTITSLPLMRIEKIVIRLLVQIVKFIANRFCVFSPNIFRVPFSI